MTHCSDEELTLYYYGEGRQRAAIERHLDDCAACAALYREIAGTLELIAAPDTPERGEQYGLEVWQRIRHHLPEREPGWWSRVAKFDPFPSFAAIGAAAAIVVAAFVAGRTWRPAVQMSSPTSVAATKTAKTGPASSATDDAASRILLASVADHLDRSERVLTDIMNAPAKSNIATEQAWAEDLIQASRLYRQDAVDDNEPSVAAMLDDLERNLLEIVHSPSTITAADLEQLRRRIDAAALLFKVRVMSDELRRREQPPAGRALPQPSTRKTS